MAGQRWAKKKGTEAERDLIKMFWENEGWCAHRIAGSGSSRFPSPDLIVGSPLRKLAIEVKKTSAKRKYLTGEEMYGLIEFSTIFGSESWIAIKFNREPWYFINTEDIRSTGDNFCVTLEDAKNKGLLFEELVR